MDLGISQLTANATESAKNVLPSAPSVPSISPSIPSMGSEAGSCGDMPLPTNVVPTEPPTIPATPPIESVPSLPAIPEIPSLDVIQAQLNLPTITVALPELPALEIPPLPTMPTIPSVTMPTMDMTIPKADCKTGMDNLNVNPVAQKAVASKENTNSLLMQVRVIFQDALDNETNNYIALAQPFADMAQKWIDRKSFPTTEEGWMELCNMTISKIEDFHDFLTVRRTNSYQKACLVMATEESKAISKEAEDYEFKKLVCSDESLAGLFNTCVSKYNGLIAHSLSLYDGIESKLNTNIKAMIEKQSSMISSSKYAFWKLYDTEFSPEVLMGGWFKKWYLIDGEKYYWVADTTDPSGKKYVDATSYFAMNSFAKRIDEINKMLPA